MQNFVNFIKENYSYFVYAFEFVFAFVGAVVAFLKSRSYKCLNDRYSTLFKSFHKRESYLEGLVNLSDLIHDANVLYPVHGDGERRFDYVYKHFLSISGYKDCEELRDIIREYVDSILHADKFKKLTRDTQEIEPKKEFSYEEKKDETIERSQDLCQDGKENKSAERSACYVPRRD